VRFGDRESPALNWREGRGLEVVVPSGYLDRGQNRKVVPVRAEMDDGSTRSLGRFLYQGYPRYFPRDRPGGACGTADTTRRRPVEHLEVRHSSQAVRLRGDTWRYRYTIENLTDSPLDFRWRLFEILGLPGGWTGTLLPHTSATVEREADGLPVEASGSLEMTGDGLVGCAFFGSLDGGGLVPASSIPYIAPVEDLTHFTDPDGNEVLQWTHPDPASLDGIDLYAESLDDEGWGTGLASTETTFTIPADWFSSPGLWGMAVVAYKWSNGARYQIVGTVR